MALTLPLAPALNLPASLQSHFSRRSSCIHQDRLPCFSFASKLSSAGGEGHGILQAHLQRNLDGGIRKIRPCSFVVRSSGSSIRTDASVSLGTAVIPAEVDLAVLESLLYKWASGISQSSNLPLPFAARVDKIPQGFRISSMVGSSADGTLQSEVDIVVTVAPAQGTEPAMFRAIREGQEKAPEWEPGLMKAMLTSLLEGVKIASRG